MKFYVTEETKIGQPRSECNAVKVNGRPGYMVYYGMGSCLKGCGAKCKGHFTKGNSLSELIVTFRDMGFIVETKTAT